MEHLLTSTSKYNYTLFESPVQTAVRHPFGGRPLFEKRAARGPRYRAQQISDSAEDGVLGANLWYNALVNAAMFSWKMCGKWPY
jgi:hypothetical protein